MVFVIINREKDDRTIGKMKIIIFTLSFCALICIGCKNKVNIPKVQFSEFSSDIIQIGADVKTLQTDKLSSFNNSDSVIELIPEIEDKETNLDFSLYHIHGENISCLLYTSPSPRDQRGSRMPSSA